MDKSRFVEIAPLYYALAILNAVQTKARGKALSLQGVIDLYSFPDEQDPSEPFRMLLYGALIDRAVAILRSNNLVDAIDDDFGSPLFKQRMIWDHDRPAILDDPNLPFAKFNSAADGEAWLNTALSGVNQQYAELGIKPEDFANPDAEWSPLPLDRTDPKLQIAVEAIDAALKQVREDNGYSATVPGERDYVVASLSTASQVLKTEAATSVPFIRQYILEPLAKVGRRFAGATLAVLSQAAKEAIIDYVKENAPEWIADLISGL